jgi:uncharacterized protein YwqG
MQPTAPSALVVSRLSGFAGKLVQCGGFAKSARRLMLAVMWPHCQEDVPMSFSGYARALRESSLPYRDELAELVRPAVFLRSQAVSSESLPIGISRLGGLPDLPNDIAWPSWQGKPQSFIAQISLSEIPVFRDRNLLPESGLLFFFYDSTQSASGTFGAERGSFAVSYSTHSGSARRPGDIPPGLDRNAIFKPARLSFTMGVTEPGWEHPILERIGLSFEERLAYAGVISQVEKPVSSSRRSFHQMLGYPSPLQYAVAWDCERAQVGFWEADRERRKILEPLIREHVEEWELLLQVDWDPHASMEWPGDGRIYYMIRRQDLETRRFDKAWFVLQST